MNLSQWELEELVPQVFGKTEEETEKLINDSYYLEDFINDQIEKNQGSLNDFLWEYTSRLMPMIFTGKSLITEKVSRGFGVIDGDKITAICKTEETNF